MKTRFKFGFYRLNVTDYDDGLKNATHDDINACVESQEDTTIKTKSVTFLKLKLGGKHFITGGNTRNSCCKQ